MRYMGGKFRQGKHIAKVVSQLLEPGMEYYEPFCGAMGSASKVVPLLERPSLAYLSDVSPALICMWQSLLDGWQPPRNVTEAQYDRIKKTRNPNDPITAYVGFGFTFGGKWFGTFARGSDGRDWGKNARNLTLKKLEAIRGAHVSCRSYELVKPTNSVVYLDPPYGNRTKCHDYDEFDQGQFYKYARMLTKNNKVILTGFEAPKDFVSVFSFGDTVVRHYAGKGSDGTIESIYMHYSQMRMLRLNTKKAGF